MHIVLQNEEKGEHDDNYYFLLIVDSYQFQSFSAIQGFCNVWEHGLMIYIINY